MTNIDNMDFSPLKDELSSMSIDELEVLFENGILEGSEFNYYVDQKIKKEMEETSDTAKSIRK